MSLVLSWGRRPVDPNVLGSGWSRGRGAGLGKPWAGGRGVPQGRAEEAGDRMPEVLQTAFPTEGCESGRWPWSPRPLSVKSLRDPLTVSYSRSASPQPSSPPTPCRRLRSPRRHAPSLFSGRGAAPSPSPSGPPPPPPHPPRSLQPRTECSPGSYLTLARSPGRRRAAPVSGVRV